MKVDFDENFFLMKVVLMNLYFASFTWWRSDSIDQTSRHSRVLESGHGQVPTWNGDEDQWFEWSFAFRAYCVVSSLISSEDLERVAGSAVPLPLTGQSPEARVKSGTLYYLLVRLCTGKAHLILRTVEVGNGVEGWRVLSARCDRPRDGRAATAKERARTKMEREKARETQNVGGVENVDTLSEIAGRNKLEGQELRGLRKSKSVGTARIRIRQFILSC